MRTILNEEVNEIIIKNSKFITIIYPFNNNLDIILERIKKNYPKADHYCYAYITQTVKRASDDKEPSNTAGIPMLNVLIKNDLINVLVVTIRYFGGIKLGTGGLVRAYTKSVCEVLKKCQFKELKKGFKIKLVLNYKILKEIDPLLKRSIILEKEFLEEIYYTLLVDEESLQNLNIYNPIIIEEILL